ncbi:MAG: cell division protein FtsA [Patescibacteria group bacterium]
MKSSNNVIAGIDIGSSKVAFVVGRVNEGLIEVAAVSSAENSGLKKGIVNDVEDCLSSISSALEQAEKKAGVPIDKAVIGVGGAHIITTLSKGIIAVSKPNGQIDSSDTERVIEAARAVALPPNQEIIHVIPRQFIVDGQSGVKDPLGMTGIRLEAEVMIIGGSTNALRSLEKCISQSGLSVNNFVFNGLASSKTLLNKKQKEVGVLLLDIGASTTTLTVWEDGDLSHANILPIGSNHVTNDIAIGLKTSLEVAEQVKIQFASCELGETAKTKIDLKKIDPKENQKVERELIDEICEARMKEIYDLVRAELKKIQKDGMLPAGVVLSGGGSLVRGAVVLAKNELHLPVQIGYPVLEISGEVELLDQPRFHTATGLMLEGLDDSYQSNNTFAFNFASLSSRDLSSYLGKIKGFFRQLLP